MGSSSSFEKVGECRHRNPSSQNYYAILKVRGKQIKPNLRINGLHLCSAVSQYASKSGGRGFVPLYSITCSSGISKPKAIFYLLHQYNHFISI